MYKHFREDMDSEAIFKMWNRVCETFSPGSPAVSMMQHSGWQTVRVFISSTFSDFHSERDELVKRIFPQLRHVLEKEQVHIIDCDLRWGIPEGKSAEYALEVCMRELDRCKTENKLPYFLNMLGLRTGSIPEIVEEIGLKYQFVEGLSVTEMEIIHGALRDRNPNALFMIRDRMFLDSVPAELHDDRDKFSAESDFPKRNDLLNLRKQLERGLLSGEDRGKLEQLEQKNQRFVKAGQTRMEILETQIKSRCSQKQIVYYTATFHSKSPDTGRLVFKLEPVFDQKVLEFFARQIRQQYARDDKLVISAEEQEHKLHQLFMQCQAKVVLGRDDVLKQIQEYIFDCSSNDVPLFIVGESGCGKSSILAHSVSTLEDIRCDNELLRNTVLFYHFTGAVPNSASLLRMLQRLLTTLHSDNKELQLPTDLMTAIQTAHSLLASEHVRPAILFVDAINQFEGEAESGNVHWLPVKLAPQVRCIVSTIHSIDSHQFTETQPTQIVVEPLSLNTRKKIVTNFFDEYKKELVDDQLNLLLRKKCSSNPLWLSVACDELRVFGEVKKVGAKIESFQDDLIRLLMQVMERLERELENLGPLLVGTLCLLEISRGGLLEVEILELLYRNAQSLHIIHTDIENESDQLGKDFDTTADQLPRLPYGLWATIYCSVRRFLRPFGEPGEGRLNFYHQSFREAVQRRYLSALTESELTLNELTESVPTEVTATGESCALNGARSIDWHRQLVDYFELCVDALRQLEEYPHHLIAVNDIERLKLYLSNWKTFDLLYDREFSSQLLKFWSQVDEKYVMMCSSYVEMLDQLLVVEARELCSRQTQVAHVLVQASLYDTAEDLATKCLLDIKSKEIGQKTQDKMMMVDLLSLLASIADQRMKVKYEYTLPSKTCDDQLQLIQSCIDYNTQALDIIQQQQQHERSDSVLLRQLAGLHTQIAMSLSYMQNCRGWTEQHWAENGVTHIRQAIKIYKQLNDTGHLAEAVMIKAFFANEEYEKQLKIYEKAEELCHSTYGRSHPLAARLQVNCGFALEGLAREASEPEQSAEYYKRAYQRFKTNFHIHLETLGPKHVHVERAKKILRRPACRVVAKVIGDVSYQDMINN